MPCSSKVGYKNKNINKTDLGSIRRGKKQGRETQLIGIWKDSILLNLFYKQPIKMRVCQWIRDMLSVPCIHKGIL